MTEKYEKEVKLYLVRLEVARNDVEKLLIQSELNKIYVALGHLKYQVREDVSHDHGD